MKQRKISVFLTFAILISTLIPMSSFAQTMVSEGGDDLNITISSSTSKVTNKDIILNIIATDEDSGVKEIILPDENKVPGGNAIYTVTQNGSYVFKATDNAGNEVEETIEIANIDKVPPVITIEPYETEPTNQDITVKATANEGKLNQDSYTFTENGSFTFIATDEAGNVTKKTITITNIDKTLPTEGEIIITAIDEEGRTIKTIQNKNLGLGVQVVTAPEIPGCKLISTSVVTIWLKPADNVKKVIFTYKLDKEWEGWEHAEKVIEEAEKQVNEAEENSTKGNKEEAQKKIDEAREVIEKLPESEDKDRLNKKLEELQKRLDKIVIPVKIPKEKDEKNGDEISEKKINKPKIKNIPLNEFVARWEGHENISEEPIYIPEKSKASTKIDKKQIELMDQKELSPRFYKWNESKGKWVALATEINKDEKEIKTYDNVEGYVAVFAVKQPTFSDVKGNEWFADVADRANGLALVEGYAEKDGDVILKPYNNISRSEFYAMTARLFGALKEGDNSLYDVLELKPLDEADEILSSTNYDVDNWAKPYTAALYEKGVVKELKGQTDLKSDITRIEAMDLMTKLLKGVENIETVDLNKFKDAAQIEKYEKLSGEKVEIANIVEGYDDKTLRPNDNMTRIEALKLIINSLEKLDW